ncbi:MAG: hypothetical protein H7343_14415 [Undibacterium sp.]|nr:hypothetical protein [Opitutaceae bacterium]
MPAAARKKSPTAPPPRAAKKSAHGDVFKKWRGRATLPDGVSVDAYLSRARDLPRR